MNIQIIKNIKRIVILGIFVLTFFAISSRAFAADRYWIGGAGSWSDTAHWSDTSGGSGGFSAPTSSDNVYFTSGSGTGTVTVDAIANMADLTFSSISAITLSNSAYAFNVYGNLTLPSSNLTVSFSSTGYLYLKATTSVNITSNGNTSSWNRIYFDGVGGTWTNQDDWSTNSSNIYLTNGTWDTNSVTVSMTSFNLGSSSLVKTLTLQNSTFITLGNWGTATTTNYWGPFALNAGTSNIICNTFTTGTTRKQFYNVTANQHSGYLGHIFNNLTFNPTSAINLQIQLYGSGIIVYGTLTINGYNDTDHRALVYGYVLGTQYTVDVSPVNVIVSNVDFRDTKFVNAIDLSTITGLSGDAGGNSGITFTTAQPQYFKHTSGAVSWSDSSKWYSDYARTTLGRVPLPQDDVYFDANSFTGTSTLTINVPRLGKNVDMSGVNQTVTVSPLNDIDIYGSFIIGNSITLWGSSDRKVLMAGRSGSFSLDTKNKQFRLVSFSGKDAQYTLLSDLNCYEYVAHAGVNTIIDLNDFNVTAQVFGNNGSTNATLYMGNGTMTLNRSVLGTLFNPPAILYSEGSTIKFNVSGSVDYPFPGGNKSYNKVWFSGSHTGNFDVTGSNTFNEIIIDPGRKVRFTAGTTQQIGKFTAIGTSANPITIGSITNATHTLNFTGAGTVVGDYLNISYSTATPANKWYASNSTNGGNNSGWTFANVPDAPTGLTPTAGNAQVSLSWTAPADNGTAITDYVVDYKLTTDSSWTTFADGVSTLTTATVIGLTNSTSYDFRVFAVNAVGIGSASATASATPYNPSDRYWVGGSGNWSDTSHWSNISGGTGGQAVPTSTNDVYFDASSFSVDGSSVVVNTTADMNNLNFSNIDQTVTLSNSAYAFSVYGDFILSSKLTASFTSTGYVYLKATTSVNIISNGNNNSIWNNIYINGAGGSWTLGDNFYSIATPFIYLQNGTLNLNGFSFSVYRLQLLGGNFNAGSSTINIYRSLVVSGGVNNFGTSNMNFLGSQGIFTQSVDVSYYDVSFKSTSSLWINNGTKSASFNNLTIDCPSFYLTGNITVNNLTIEKIVSTQRVLIYSDILGTQRTLTAANVSASNVDFRDIKGAGAGNWDLSAITGLSGDAGGNSGITFTTAQPQYFKHTSGAVSWSDSSKWYSDYARTILGRVPLPQDDVYFDANSFTGTSTLTVNVPRIGRSLDMSAVNQSVTMTLANAIESYGSFVLGNNITPSGSYVLLLYGRNNNFDFNLFGKTLYWVDINNPNCTYTVKNPFTLTSLLRHYNGTLDFNDYSATVYSFWANSGTVYQGNGVLTTTRVDHYQIYIDNTVTYFSENSTLKLNPTYSSNSIPFFGGDKTFNKVWFSGSGTYTGSFSVLGSNIFNEIVIDASRNVRFTAGTTQQIGKFTAIGTSANPITIGSVTSATHTLNFTGTGTVVGDYLNISYSTATPANKWYASNSTNGGNNSGWIFANVPDAPIDLVGTSGNSQVSLSWQAPANNGGLAITDYIIEYKISTDSVWTTFSDGISTNTTAVVTGLINGTSYDFQVSAVNPVGQSNASTTTTATPMTVPGAPTINSVTPLDGQISVDFSAPASDGGSPITSYTVTSNPGGIIGTGVSSPIVVSGLSNGTPYTFTITATNAIGEGPSSSPSASVTPRTVPNAPTALSATFGNSQVSLSWMAPSFDGGSPIIDYAVEYKISSDSIWSTFADGVSIDLSAIVTGLSNGTPYDFRVSAINIAGQGDPSDTVNATPATVPDAPTITSVVPANGQVTVYFDPPLSDGGSMITSYTVTSNPGNIIEVGATSPITVTGLTNGTPYTFTVTATNIAGTSAPSTESDEVVPATIPDTPTALFASPGNAFVDLSWTAPLYNGGSAITDYAIEYKISSDSVWSTFADGVSTDTTATVTGLSNGTSYDFRVSAVNVMGQSSPSTGTSATPVTVPDAPTNISATAGNAQATVSFDPPAFDGGSTINSYTVTSNPGGITATGNSSPITITGLTNGTTYTFTVTATNAIGEGPSSSPSNAVTPVTVPDAPTSVVAVEGNSEATVSFTPPAFDGGTPITSYTATSNPGNFTGTSNGSPIVVGGLTNGMTYTFTVVATNNVGDSLPSAPSNSVTLFTEPSEPVNLASTVLGSSIGLTWSPPLSNGGSAITDYVIEYKLTSGGVWSIFADGLNVNTTAIVTGLSNGASYDFRVKAVNIIGEGPASSTVTATPGEPAQVIIQSFSDLTVSDIGANVRITNEGSEDYEYQYTWCITDSDSNLCGGGDDLFSATAAKQIDAGENWDTNLVSTVLVPGNYFFHINVIYGSESSNAYQSFTALATYPNTPTNISATAGNAEATISFDPPAFDGGSPINSYTVTSNPGGLTATGNSSPITITGLSNGTTYTFTVTATNAIGEGPSSSPSNAVTPVTVPDAPTSVVAVPGDKKVSLSWTAPINDGGSPVIDYIVEYKLSSESNWIVFADGVSTNTFAIVTGLTNNFSYDFRISAVNAYGQSAVIEANIFLPNQGGGSTGSSSGSIVVQNPIITEVIPETIIDQGETTKPTTKIEKGKTNNNITNSNLPIPENIKLPKNETRSTPVERPKKSIFPSEEVASSGNAKIYRYIIIISSGIIFIWFVLFIIKKLRRRNTNY